MDLYEFRSRARDDYWRMEGEARARGYPPDLEDSADFYVLRRVVEVFGYR